MSIRRTFAAVLSVGALFLATACAGDDLDSSGSDKSSGSSSTPTASTSESATTSAGGSLTLAGPSASLPRTARRVGSASAWKTTSSRPG